VQATNKRGKQSFVLPNQPVIAGWASVVGKKESEGPLRKYFDITCQDTRFGQKTWEQAEKQMQKMAIERLLIKCSLERSRSARCIPGIY
jgi:stage V sporulation protein AD